MLTKKFSGATLEETLKTIKRELGPDAIILKTVTNKGIKKAFNKNRIEITAAIPEKDYVNKIAMDKSLPVDQKEKFYSNSSQHIAESIKSYADHNAHKVSQVSSGYGKLALNRSVKETNLEEKKSAFSELDSFLSVESLPTTSPGDVHISNMIEVANSEKREEQNREIVTELVDQRGDRLSLVEEKIVLLQRQLTLLSDHRNIHSGLNQIVQELQAHDIDCGFINDFTKKVITQYGDKELNSYEFLFDYCLGTLTEKIHVQMPLFSSVQLDGKATINLIYSEYESGQTTSIIKMMSMLENCFLINWGDRSSESKNFTKTLLNIEAEKVDNLTDLLALCRKLNKEGKTVFIDYKSSMGELKSVKKIVDSLRRSFEFVESYLSLSAIHSELYNKKILNESVGLVDGVIFSYLDHCLNFSHILNVHFSNTDIPLKFFSTGPQVPDDIETASPERVLSKIFKL